MRTPIAILLLTIASPVWGQAPVLHEPLPVAGDESDFPTLDSDELLLDDDSGDPSDSAAGADDADGPGGFAVDAVPRLSPPGDVRLDGDTGRDDVLTYFAVFDPSVAPFKRSYVRDQLRDDGALGVSDDELRPLPPERRRQRPDRELFWGSLLVELADGRPVPIPSVAADGAVIELETAPPLPVELLVDAADNLYLRSAVSGRVRLNLLLDAPPGYFGGPLPGLVTLGELPPRPPTALPAPFDDAGRAVFAAIRATRGRSAGPLDAVPVAEALTDLTAHFRAFEPGQLGEVPDDPVGRYRAIALGGRGVCRHRAYAFVVTALSIGMTARYVANEAHAFAEVLLPADGGWRRIDLGGGAAGFDVRGAAHRARHLPGRPDPLPRPEAYSHSYSAPAPTPGVASDASAAGGPFRDGASGGARSAPGVAPALVTLDRTLAHVFRGEAVPVSGRVRLPGAAAPRGGLVEILLVTAAPRERARRLGVVPTRADGRFEAALRVPPEVPPGRYGLAARYLGGPESR